ncbi:hypothetical protein VTK56DRAFT_2428 [Thermocarpiscus australiensis]
MRIYGTAAAPSAMTFTFCGKFAVYCDHTLSRHPGTMVGEVSGSEKGSSGISRTKLSPQRRRCCTVEQITRDHGFLH